MRLAYLALAGFMAGLTGALAQVRFSVGPVPYTMQNMGVILAGLLLPPTYALLSMLLYVLLIAIGVPAAAGFHGGLAVLLGYTGGYILGFVIAAPLMSVLSRAYLSRRRVSLDSIGGRDIAVLLALSLVAALPVYLLGFIVFAHYALPGTGLYSWSSKVCGWLGLPASSRLLVLLVATTLVFLPQDLFVDHLLAVLVARGAARIMRARGLLA